VVALWLLRSVSAVEAQELRSWETVMTAGERAFDQGNYAEAARHFQAALVIAEELTPSDPPEEDDPVTWRVSTSLTNLAIVYHTQGQYAQAAPLYERALTLQEQMFGPEHPQLVDVLQAYADLQRKMHPVRSRLPWSTANKLAVRARRILERSGALAPPGLWSDYSESEMFRSSE
jgi:tetratricopeptide (TPR) repeat protein